MPKSCELLSQDNLKDPSETLQIGFAAIVKRLGFGRESPEFLPTHFLEGFLIFFGSVKKCCLIVLVNVNGLAPQLIRT